MTLLALNLGGPRENKVASHSSTELMGKGSTIGECPRVPFCGLFWRGHSVHLQADAPPAE